MLPSALLLALTGTLLLFDSALGINWGIWVTLVALGIAGAQWMERGRVGRATAGLALLACAFAWGPTVTASPAPLVLGVLAAFVALSLAILTLPDEFGNDITCTRGRKKYLVVFVRGLQDCVDTDSARLSRCQAHDDHAMGE